MGRGRAECVHTFVKPLHPSSPLSFLPYTKPQTTPRTHETQPSGHLEPTLGVRAGTDDLTPTPPSTTFLQPPAPETTGCSSGR